MTFEEYQKIALTTLEGNADPLMQKTIWMLGIAGEAGEVVEKWKKIVAYHNGVVTEEDKEGLKGELGDVLWYIAVIAHELGLPLEDVVARNVKKLADRKKRDVIKGRGDNR